MRLLVVKLSDIGDVLTATPSLRALRRSLPTARIDALVPPSSAPVLEASPLVDEIIPFDKSIFDSPLSALNPASLAYAQRLIKGLRKRRYDAVLILHHLTTWWGTAKYALLSYACGAHQRLGLDNGRGWFLSGAAPDVGFGGRHEVEHWLEVVTLLGAKHDNPQMELALSPEDEAFAGAHVPQSCSPLVAIHPGAGAYSPAKRWSPEGFSQVAQALTQEGARIVLVGGPQERELAGKVLQGLDGPAIDLTGQTTIKQLAAILKGCHLLIGNDSGVTHVAAAVRTPVVAVFGPSNHLAWGPWAHQQRAAVVRVDLPCSPCLYVGHRLGKRNGCPEMACLRSITPEMVLAAASRLLAQGEPSRQTSSTE